MEWSNEELIDNPPDYVSLRDAYVELRDEVRRLRPFARHKFWCASTYSNEACNCGFDTGEPKDQTPEAYQAWVSWQDVNARVRGNY